MATTTRKAEQKSMSPEQQIEFLNLIKGADSVELKLTIPESEQYGTIAKLDLDALDAQIRQVFFFDTPDLTLYKAGVVPRARRVQGREGDTVVKLRPVVPAELPKEVRKSPSFGVEVDAMPGGFVCSGSMKGVADNNEIWKTVNAVKKSTGAGAIRSLFSKEQRALFAENKPVGIDWDDLSVLGPIFVLKLKFATSEFNRKIVAEAWMYPDSSRVLELSTKCLPTEAFQVIAELRAFLIGKGIDLGGEQSTKTLKALNFYAERLKGK